MHLRLLSVKHERTKLYKSNNKGCSKYSDMNNFVQEFHGELYQICCITNYIKITILVNNPTAFYQPIAPGIPSLFEG